MRINVNLASLKYEDARRFYLRWGTLLAIILIATVLLGSLAWSDFRSSKQDRQAIADLRGKIAAVEEEQQKNEAILNLPKNQDVRDQSGFWNEVIDQKAFSWTQLFSDLEKIMPGRAYVISVQPTLTKERRLKLKLMIAGEKHEDAVQLVRKMESSERFRFPEIIDETSMNQQGRPPIVQFDIETYYTPAAPLPAHTTPREGS